MYNPFAHIATNEPTPRHIFHTLHDGGTHTHLTRISQHKIMINKIVAASRTNAASRICDGQGNPIKIVKTCCCGAL